MITAQSKRINRRFSRSRIGLIVAGIVLLILCFNTARATYNTSTFFSLMEDLHFSWDLGVDPQVTEAYLSDLKHIARFVLNAPKIDRRIMITTYYYSFKNMDTSGIEKYGERAVNLFLLERLIFDVPQVYPMDKARSFAAFLWEGKDPYPTENVANMLWPFGYENGDITIKAPLVGLYSDYRGLREYNYFSSHFSFRSIDELR